MGQSKVCSRCKQAQPLSQFGPSKQTPDGLFRYCRACKRLADAEAYARNKQKWAPGRRAYYQANRDVYIARATAQYERDRDAGKVRAREWALANTERRREIRQASAARAYSINPEPKRETWRRRHAAIRRGCAVYPFTPAQLAAKVEFWGSQCWICRGPYDSIDHVKPLAKRGPHMLANLRPICTPCNTRKRDRWPFRVA